MQVRLVLFLLILTRWKFYDLDSFIFQNFRLLFHRLFFLLFAFEIFIYEIRPLTDFLFHFYFRHSSWFQSMLNLVHRGLLELHNCWLVYRRFATYDLFLLLFNGSFKPNDSIAAQLFRSVLLARAWPMRLAYGGLFCTCKLWNFLVWPCHGFGLSFFEVFFSGLVLILVWFTAVCHLIR